MIFNAKFFPMCEQCLFIKVTNSLKVFIYTRAELLEGVGTRLDHNNWP